MPKIEQLNVIDITPEKFLNACDRVELHELDLLLGNALGKLDDEEYESLPAGERKMSMREVLIHCLEYGTNGAEGISVEAQARIKEFLTIAGESIF